ncbi:hypothetical protein WSM22_37890 [Cytophagales bacterium WSM2-2]|nr:hypothetical protein WSM22_37890 [Cytophagales bacterium WSM2-2]
MELLLKAGANPLPEENNFPLTCLGQLKLLLKYGARINTLSEKYYDLYTQESKRERSSTSQTGHWTPIMVYLKELLKFKKKIE